MIARCDHPVRLVARRELSSTCFAIRLASELPLEAIPGQFAMLACGNGLDPFLRRPFSLAGVSAGQHGTIVELMVKEVGRATTLLRHQALGNALQMLAPLGNGFDLTAVAQRPFALVAGGIGLPPVLFAAEVLAATGTPFDLYLGAATASELFEVERGRAATTRSGGELITTTDDGSAGENGFVTSALLRRVTAGSHYGRVLACGPTPMLAALADLGRARSLDVELSLEEPMACGMGVCLGCVVTTADRRRVPSCKEGPVFKARNLAERWWE